jgi:twitching motility protein PilT
MAQLDKFIEALHRHKAEKLEVAAGKPITIGVNGASQPATTQPLTEEQVTSLLQEIVPAPNAEDFIYDAPTGTVRVVISRPGGALRLEIVPLSEKEATPTPAAEDDPSPNGAVAEKDSGVVVGGSRSRERIERLFREMIEQGCSDLHISTGSPPMFRKNGDIVLLNEEEPLTESEARETLLSITPPHKFEEFEELHDTDFAYEIENLGRFRCNLFMDRKGMGGVFRVIPTHIKTAQELGLSKQMIDLCNLSKGLVVVTGPTGSGKSTTLAALLDHINRNRCDHVITIEDPIEFVHPNQKCLINQREVGVHTQGFKVALRAALREDPDVVLVGEMRDLETVEIAIETAETGHLVFGTLHTNTAPSTVDRIIDQFPAGQQGQIRTMLSESLKGVISQTLIKAKKGGLVAALEFLVITPAVSNLIREGKTYQIPSVMQTAKNVGMVTLNDALYELVLNGVVAPEEAYKKAVDRSELENIFSRNGIDL